MFFCVCVSWSWYLTKLACSQEMLQFPGTSSLGLVHDIGEQVLRWMQRWFGRQSRLSKTNCLEQVHFSVLPEEAVQQPENPLGRVRTNPRQVITKLFLLCLLCFCNRYLWRAKEGCGDHSFLGWKQSLRQVHRSHYPAQRADGEIWWFVQASVSALAKGGVARCGKAFYSCELLHRNFKIQNKLCCCECFALVQHCWCKLFVGNT